MLKLSKYSPFLAILVFMISLFHPKVLFAACTPVGTNVTTCSGSQIACSQQLPVAGGIRRWCCDDQLSCDIEKGVVQEQITNQLAVNSAEAFPRIGFPCDEENNPEFHSLRPYQGVACGDANKAVYCSNQLKFIESFDLTHLCPVGNATADFDCPVNFPVPKHDLFVELDDSMFPIMGNTEEVTNSQGGTEVFDDATKVNEYASWYLSGVNNRAEYGENTDDKVVNYSGPVQKLLPKLIQEAQRIATIKTATTKTSRVDEDSGRAIDETENHNQVVVCANETVLNILGQTIPEPCYGGNEYRLKDWEGDLSSVRTGAQKVVSGGLVGVTGGLLGNLIPDNGVVSNVLDNINIPLGWNKRTPPLPWDDGTAEIGEAPVPFESSILYQKAYAEWQGKSCAILPLVGLVCIDNPFIKNKWADLYQYIPLSNTTDKMGNEVVFDVRIQPSQGTEVPQDSEEEDEANRKSAPLYFAHTQEVKESSELLNKTYTPDGFESEKLPESTEKNVCSVVNVRTNKGDNLFPGDRPSGEEIVVPGVSYTITGVRCKVVAKEVTTINTTINPDVCPGGLGERCTVIESKPSCDAEVTVNLVTAVRTPNANEIFATTVADSGSTFRKIFPRVEQGAPVTCIADIPTVTGVKYTHETTLKVGETDFKVESNPKDGGGSGDNPELTFPHIGSIYEYFLKGIQTALRPKGYGEPIYDGLKCESMACGEWESKLETKINACGICNAPIGDLAKKILANAGTAYNVPAANIWAAMKHEGADGYQGTTYDFSDENVRKWSESESCGGEPMPGCDNNIDSTQPPFGFLSHWFYLGDGDNALWRAVQKIDPSRDSPEKVSRCNFLDAAYAAAKLLNQSATNTTAGASCSGYTFDTIPPATCSSTYWTPAKIVQSQTGYAGYCVQGPLYTVEDTIDWFNDAKCN